MARTQELFSIGDVAQLFHLSVSSLRHYETIGPAYAGIHRPPRPATATTGRGSLRCSTPSATCARWICRSGRSAPFCATATSGASSSCCASRRPPSCAKPGGAAARRAQDRQPPAPAARCADSRARRHPPRAQPRVPHCVDVRRARAAQLSRHGAVHPHARALAGGGRGVPRQGGRGPLGRAARGPGSSRRMTARFSCSTTRTPLTAT